jgi:hypothetical protein
MTCPHCWPPAAQARAAENAARVAHEVAQAVADRESRALLARLLAGATDAEMTREAEGRDETE